MRCIEPRTFVAVDPEAEIDPQCWGFARVTSQRRLNDETKGYKVNDTVIIELTMTVAGEPTHNQVDGSSGPVPVPPVSWLPA